MKGIILAGGTGSRLFPLTKVTNKHLLPVGKKPMILHPVEKLVSAGIKEIMVVTGVEHMGAVVTLLGSGKDFGCRFTYKVQDEAGGIAQALGLCEDFGRDDRVVVLLGDNIFTDELGRFVTRFQKKDKGAMVLIKEVKDPERFGVPDIQNGKLMGIVEKPENPKSSFAVTGIYFYDHHVFEIIRKLRPSRRNELEITDVNNAYLAEGNLEFDTMVGDWTDAGTFESLQQANQLMSKAAD